MQRHVNDWAGTLKAAIPFLQILQRGGNEVRAMNDKQFKLLGEVLFEARDIVEAAEATLKAGPKQPQTLVQELAQVINRRSLENGSNTPDFILADFLSRCLVAFDDTTNARATWYGKKDTAFNKAAGASVSPEENEALKKRQFPAGGVISEMRKQAGREIMADIENKTSDILQGMPKEYQYIPADLWKEFNRVNTELAELWQEGRLSSQEYKDLQKHANELAAEIGKIKKEAIEKEATDKMARMVTDVMRVVDAFTMAAKAVQIFNREAKEADAIRLKFDHMVPKTGGQDPKTGKKRIVDEKGFLFLTEEGKVLWAMHDGLKYCYCEHEATGWVGWQVEESAIIEAGHTQLPLFLDQYMRKLWPTE